MKRVLIIANLHHASPRIPGIATHLPEFGWEPVIVTPPLGDDDAERWGFPANFPLRVRIAEAPYGGDVLTPWRRLLGRAGFDGSGGMTERIKERIGVTSRRGLVEFLLNAYQALFAYPDAERTWLHPASRAGRDVPGNFDAVMSSCPYPTSHIVAARLARALSIPWIADFRDAWSQNHNYEYGALRQMLDARLERRVMRGASAIVAAAPGYARKQAAFLGRPVTVISNGYDPEDLNEPPAPLTNRFTITYTGAIYAAKERVDPLFTAIARMIGNGVMDPARVEVRFYGPRYTWLAQAARDRNLTDVVRLYGQVSRPDAIRRQRESQLLFLMNWEDPGEQGVYRLKLFEYLAARRPVLLTGGTPHDAMQQLLEQAQAGYYAADAAGVERVLTTLYGQHRQSGEVPYHGDREFLKQFSYRAKAAEFTRVFSEVQRTDDTGAPAPGTLSQS